MTHDDATEDTSSRRSFLRRTGRALAPATAIGGLTLATRLARGAYDEQPEFVTLTFDRDRLERYQPLLDLRNVSIRPTTTYAWVASSEEETTDMLVYWVWYSAGQQGVSEEDSHVPDREPVMVEVDANGDVEAVHYDRIHWKAETVYDPPLYDGDHVSLRVVEPWHPYRIQHTTEHGELTPGIESLHSVYAGWIDNGWPVHRPSVVNPWRLPFRGHWWQDGWLGFSREAFATNLYLDYGLPIVGRKT